MRRRAPRVSACECHDGEARRRVPQRESRVYHTVARRTDTSPHVPGDYSGRAGWRRRMHDAPPCREARWGVSRVFDPDDDRLRYRANRLSSPAAKALPEAEIRMADTRVHRAPRFALQPRSNRSGGHNPIGRQAIARPPPIVGSMCTECARSACEVGMVTNRTRNEREWFPTNHSPRTAMMGVVARR